MTKEEIQKEYVDTIPVLGQIVYRAALPVLQTVRIIGKLLDLDNEMAKLLKEEAKAKEVAQGQV